MQPVTLSGESDLFRISLFVSFSVLVFSQSASDWKMKELFFATLRNLVKCVVGFITLFTDEMIMYI